MLLRLLHGCYHEPHPYWTAGPREGALAQSGDDPSHGGGRAASPRHAQAPTETRARAGSVTQLRNVLFPGWQSRGAKPRSRSPSCAGAPVGSHLGPSSPPGPHLPWRVCRHLCLHSICTHPSPPHSCSHAPSLACSRLATAATQPHPHPHPHPTRPDLDPYAQPGCRPPSMSGLASAPSEFSTPHSSSSPSPTSS